MPKKQKPANGWGVINTRTMYPKVPAPKGYIYNANGALINWPYCVKRMMDYAPEVFTKIDAEDITIQEKFIRFNMWYENDTGAEFELNLIRD